MRDINSKSMENALAMHSWNFQTKVVLSKVWLSTGSMDALRRNYKMRSMFYGAWSGVEPQAKPSPLYIRHHFKKFTRAFLWNSHAKLSSWKRGCRSLEKMEIEIKFRRLKISKITTFVLICLSCSFLSVCLFYKK